MTRQARLAALCGATLLAASPDIAAAQSLSPMRHDALAFGERAGIRLKIGNPAARRLILTVSAYEADWSPLRGARASRRTVRLPPGETTSLLVTVPMEGATERSFRVCVTSDASGIPLQGQDVRGQVCGRYRAVRRAL